MQNSLFSFSVSGNSMDTTVIWDSESNRQKLHYVRQAKWKSAVQASCHEGIDSTVVLKCVFFLENVLAGDPKNIDKGPETAVPPLKWHPSCPVKA